MKKMIDKIVKWLKEKVKKSGAKGIVFGLSGGLDSSVVAVLSKRAVGKNLLTIILPCESSKQDLIDAEFIAKHFKIKTAKIDLTFIYREFIKKFPKGNKVAKANIKPRLRMLTLYYFANNLNYLVCGTGNKSEAVMGYFTKYGDGGVDILPIGDLTKIEVKKIAEELKIPERIINKTPSAGLWKGQTDEGEMGITYNELDGMLRGKIPFSKKIKSKIKKAEHKLKTPEIFKK